MYFPDLATHSATLLLETIHIQVNQILKTEPL